MLLLLCAAALLRPFVRRSARVRGGHGTSEEGGARGGRLLLLERERRDDTRSEGEEKKSEGRSGDERDAQRPERRRVSQRVFDSAVPHGPD